MYEDLLPWQDSGIEEKHILAAEQSWACGHYTTYRYADALSFVIANGTVYVRGNRTNLNTTLFFFAQKLMLYSIVLQDVAQRFKDALPKKPIGIVLAVSDHPYQNIRM